MPCIPRRTLLESTQSALKRTPKIRAQASLRGALTLSRRDDGGVHHLNQGCSLRLLQTGSLTLFHQRLGVRKKQTRPI